MLQWSKELAEVLCVGHVHSTSTTILNYMSSADEIAEIRTLAVPLGKCDLASLISRPPLAFCRLQYGKAGRGAGIFSHMSDVRIERVRV